MDVRRVGLDGGGWSSATTATRGRVSGSGKTLQVVSVLATSRGALGTSQAQAGIGDVLENRDGLRDAVARVALGRSVFQRCG